MEKNLSHLLYQKINEDIHLDRLDSDRLDQEALKQAIIVRVEYLLDKDPNLLFSYLYRLDVLEKDLKFALSNLSSLNAIEQIAQLILDRQLDRLQTRKKYPQAPLDGWE